MSFKRIWTVGSTVITMKGPIQGNTASGKPRCRRCWTANTWQMKKCWTCIMKKLYLYLCREKRKQALVATNLSGISRPTEMNRGPSKAPCLTIILGVISLKKTQAKIAQLSDDIGAITINNNIPADGTTFFSKQKVFAVFPSVGFLNY